jgi:hypothetical protein
VLNKVAVTVRIALRLARPPKRVKKKREGKQTNKNRSYRNHGVVVFHNEDDNNDRGGP